MESEDALFTVGEQGEGEVENDDGDMVKYSYKFPKIWTYDTMFNYESEDLKEFF